MTVKVRGTHERALLDAMEDAGRRVQQATLPAPLVGTLGEHARELWATLDVPARRLIIDTVATVKVRRVGKGRRTRSRTASS